jgi:hypothetical protein
MKRRFLFLLMAVCSFVGANAAINRANNYLYANDVTAKTGLLGQTVEVTLNMKNAKEIINWKTTLAGLPEGVTFVKAEAADRWSEEVVATDLTLFSETENAVAAGDGVVAKITLSVAATVAEGEYDIQLKDVVMTAADGTSIAQVESKTFKLTIEPGSEEKKGDLTGDGDVNAADIQALLNIIASGEFDPRADLTGDGDVNAGDIQALLNIIAEQ